MKKFGWLFLFWMGIQAMAQTKKPNILIIFADDLGWADLSCYGSTFYETPNLDKLALGGTKFTNGYATSPVCSPTRASLMTGKFPVKTGVTDWIPGRQALGKTKSYEKMIGPETAYELALNETTLAEHLIQKGYKTFFAGKWHLGEEEKFWPENQGFQTNLGGWSKGAPYGRKNDTTGGYFTPYANPRLTDGPKGEYITDRLADECIRFIDKVNDEPFFIMYSLYAVHNPMQAPADLIKKYEQKRKGVLKPGENALIKDEPWMEYENGWIRRTVQEHPVYAAMIENMDINIGRILEKLKAKGILENTLIIFTSDNGGLSTAEGSPTVNGHLHAGKGWLFEGGIRVPYIMYWQGKISSGLTTDIPVTVADIFPTVARAADAQYIPEAAMDGQDVLTLLQDTGRSYERPLFWHYPHYSNQGGKPGAAIRRGKWKLIYYYEDESIELFDLFSDPRELKNISGSELSVSKELKNQLLQWLKQNNASAPRPNTGYQPGIKK